VNKGKSSMKTQVLQERLAETSLGRITLHLLCLMKDHKFLWHYKGIVREFVRH